MNEVVLNEAQPSSTLASIVEFCEPQLAQIMLQTSNRLYPLTERSEHLKRIRSSPRDHKSGDTNGTAKGALQLLLEVGDEDFFLGGSSPCGEKPAVEAVSPEAGLFHAIDDAWPLDGDAVAERLKARYSNFIAAINEQRASGGLVKERRKCTTSTNASADHEGTTRQQEGKTIARESAAPDPGAAWAGTFRLTHVPTHAPRQQPELWAQANSVWPLALPKPVALLPPSASLCERSAAIMRRVVLPLAAQQYSLGLLGLAAAVVDPVTGDVLATSEGCLSMRRDCLAACAPYGHLPEPIRTSASAVAHGLTMEAPGFILDHPVTFALKKLAQAQEIEETQKSTDGGAEAMGEARRSPHECASKSGKPYLANHLDVYVSHEPCVMCAMALVHSRVERVFFCYPNPTHGGLGSRYWVHCLPSLNHHYRAFHCYDVAESAV